MACVALLQLLPRALINLDVYDEGIRLYGGMRVLAGAQPYHDFFAYYGPATYYWPAALFGAFGEQLVVARLGTVFFVLVALWALVQLLQRAGVGGLGVCCAAGAVLLPLSALRMFTLDPALAFAFSAAALLLGGVGTLRLLGAGVSVGLATAFRHDFGAYAAVSVVVLLAASGWQRGREGLSILLRRAALVASGVLGAVLGSYGPVAARDPLRVWDCLVPKLAYLMEFRTLPYGHSLSGVWQTFSFLGASVADDLRLVVLLAPVLFGALLLGLLVPSLRRDILSDRSRAGGFMFFVCFGLGLWLYALRRSDYTHAYPLYVATIGGLALLLGAARREMRPPRAWAALSAAFALIMAVAVSVGTAANWVAWQARTPAPWARARGIRIDSQADWLGSLISDLERYAGEAPVFIGSGRHDRVHQNPLLIYFLTGRASATYYHDLLPGLTTTEEVQRRIIADLDASGVRAVGLWLREPPQEPNRSATERGSTLLDRYLASHFAVKAKNPAYRVLARKP